MQTAPVPVLTPTPILAHMSAARCLKSKLLVIILTDSAPNFRGTKRGSKTLTTFSLANWSRTSSQPWVMHARHCAAFVSRGMSSEQRKIPSNACKIPLEAISSLIN